MTYISNRTTRHRSEQGFTLVELMVVVLIIGVLLGIAIPTFLGARGRGQDAVAKSSVKTAVGAVLTQVMSGAEFDMDKVGELESSIKWTADASDGPKVVSFAGGDNGDGSGGWAGFAARSESGTCWLIKGYDDTYMSGGSGNPNIKLLYGTTDTDNCVGELADKYATKSSF